MKRVLQTLAVALAVGLAWAQPAVEPFRDGERVLFLGDSITHNARYVANLQLYWNLRHPGSDSRYYNVGHSGGRVCVGRENYGYEAGRFSNIKFTYNEAKKTLTIGDREGEFPGMLKERTFIIVPVSKTKAQGYDPEAQGVVVKYNGQKVEKKL